MMLFSRFSLVTSTVVVVFVLGLLLVSWHPTSAQESALCTAQTAAVNANPNMTAAVLALNVAAAQQTVACIQAGDTSCPIDVTSEQQAVDEACTTGGGVNYDPSLTVSCDNDNSNVVTTLVIQYDTCIGVNCTPADQIDAANAALTNVTNALNVVLEPDNISCEAFLSSGAAPAVAKVGGGLLFVTTIVGVAIMGTVVVGSW